MTDWLNSIKPFTQEEAEKFREDRHRHDREMRQKKCPWCDYPSYKEFTVMGRHYSIGEQDVMRSVICKDGKYWHKGCLPKYVAWRADILKVWAELAWHIKIELTCCPKPVYPKVRVIKKNSKDAKRPFRAKKPT